MNPFPYQQHRMGWGRIADREEGCWWFPSNRDRGTVRWNGDYDPSENVGWTGFRLIGYAQTKPARISL